MRVSASTWSARDTENSAARQTPRGPTRRNRRFLRREEHVSRLTKMLAAAFFFSAHCGARPRVSAATRAAEKTKPTGEPSSGKRGTCTATFRPAFIFLFFFFFFLLYSFSFLFSFSRACGFFPLLRSANFTFETRPRLCGHGSSRSCFRAIFTPSGSPRFLRNGFRFLRGSPRINSERPLGEINRKEYTNVQFVQLLYNSKPLQLV